MLENKMAFPNTTNCENKLKEKYKIPKSKKIIIKNIQTNSMFDLSIKNHNETSDRIKLEFFHPETKEKLNSKICEEVKSPIKIPFKNSNRLRPDDYILSKKLAGIIDIYDKETPGYHTRCLKSKDYETNGDTSVNFRRMKLYQNETIGCSTDCEYTGLDENMYVVCDCKLKEDSAISNNSTGFMPLFSFPNFNYDIVLCYKEVGEDVRKFCFICLKLLLFKFILKIYLILLNLFVKYFRKIYILT